MQVEEEHIENSLINLNVKKEIVIEHREDFDAIYLYPYYLAEQTIAEKLIGLRDADNIKEMKKFAQELKKL